MKCIVAKTTYKKVFENIKPAIEGETSTTLVVYNSEFATRRGKFNSK